MSFLEACYRSDDKALATKVLNSVRKDLQQQVKFYNSLEGNKADNMAYDKKNAEDYLQALSSIEQMYSGKKLSPETGGGNIINPVVPKAKADATSTDTNSSK